MWIKSIAAAVLLGLSGAAPAQAEDNFSEAVGAFKSGEYRRALTLFERERQGGNGSANLLYNLGVTHLKLADYREAEHYFQRLLEHPQWRDLARFQLALVAEKRGDGATAARRYAEVEAAADSPKLRRLSLARLAALVPRQAPGPGENRSAARTPWLAIASVSAGYDDNVFAMQNELLAQSSMGEDSFTDLFAWGQYRLKGTAEDGWRLQGLAYRRGYSEYSALDLGSYRLGVLRDLHWSGWQAELGFSADATYLDGDPLTRETGVSARFEKTIAATEIGVAYLPSHYSGGRGYSYLDGWRHRLEARIERPLGQMTVNALYRLDVNDRQDRRSAGGDLYSYSPTRHTASLELEWPLGEKWEFSCGAAYRASEYDGVNRLTDTDGDLKERVREADRVTFWLSSQLSLSPRLQLAGKVSFTDNKENFDLYTYDKSEASLGVSYTF